jgi:sulfite reductase (NADPH) flavoprotein alpha-component
MSDPTLVPFIPESAPFTAEQRAYLNGFLAGLFSRVPAPAQAGAAPPAALTPLTILFGSQTGNCENLAKRIAKEAGKRAFAPVVHDLAAFEVDQLPSAANVLIVASTYGEGEPPDSAKGFWQWLSGDKASPLPHLRFSVCALGDTNYAQFCAFGKAVDARLSALGAMCVVERQDCDVDHDVAFGQWLDRALTALSSQADAPPVSASSSPATASSVVSSEPQGYGRQRPFPSRLLTNQRLNNSGSAKDTRHFGFSLAGSGLTYEAGDALGVAPRNCPELVDEIIQALKVSGDEAVPGRGGAEVSLREALQTQYEITRIPMPFLKAMAERSGDNTLIRFSSPGQNGELTAFLKGRELIDVLLAHPTARISPAELIACLKPISPRLYSISSSPHAHAGEVHLTVAIVRYDTLGRRRKGVCSTYLAERTCETEPVPIFIQPNKNFRPPRDHDRPAIMVGPGTGIAPFRAFLHERRAHGAKGKNWLFFGDQHAATDFLYQAEIELMLTEGTLTRCDTAFSRDQEERIYVQHRMLEQARELYAWLEEGASFYICGDASRMAKDVDHALHQVIAQAGGKTVEEAAEYVQKLQSEKRYLRDVY